MSVAVCFFACCGFMSTWASYLLPDSNVSVSKRTENQADNSTKCRVNQEESAAMVLSSPPKTKRIDTKHYQGPEGCSLGLKSASDESWYQSQRGRVWYGQLPECSVWLVDGATHTQKNDVENDSSLKSGAEIFVLLLCGMQLVLGSNVLTVLDHIGGCHADDDQVF